MINPCRFGCLECGSILSNLELKVSLSAMVYNNCKRWIPVDGEKWLKLLNRDASNFCPCCLVTQNSGIQAERGEIAQNRSWNPQNSMHFWIKLNGRGSLKVSLQTEAILVSICVWAFSGGTITMERFPQGSFENRAFKENFYYYSTIVWSLETAF